MPSARVFEDATAAIKGPPPINIEELEESLMGRIADALDEKSRSNFGRALGGKNANFNNQLTYVNPKGEKKDVDTFKQARVHDEQRYEGERQELYANPTWENLLNYVKTSDYVLKGARLSIEGWHELYGRAAPHEIPTKMDSGKFLANFEDKTEEELILNADALLETLVARGVLVRLDPFPDAVIYKHTRGVGGEEGDDELMLPSWEWVRVSWGYDQVRIYTNVVFDRLFARDAKRGTDCGYVLRLKNPFTGRVFFQTRERQSMESYTIGLPNPYPRPEDSICFGYLIDRILSVCEVPVLHELVNGTAHQRAEQYRQMVIDQVTADGLALEFASQELKNDKKVLKEAIRQNSNAVKHAGEFSDDYAQAFDI